MPREDYQDKLQELRTDVIAMSDLVVERAEMAMDALDSRDDDIAWDVIDGDEDVNDVYLELERDCVDLLALQQPVAGDLRLIAASFKIITDLERVGDLATNLADYSIEAQRRVFPDVDVQGLAGDALQMVRDATRAYEEEDVALCHEIADHDEELDERCERINRRIIRELIQREHEVESDEEIDELMVEVSRLLLTVRDLERVGDHAVNIAARTLYMVENDDELIW